MNESIKDTVRSKYGSIAGKGPSSQGCGCNCADGSAGRADDAIATQFSMASTHYERLQGYEPDADLALGCGLPTRFADLSPGETVLDLGSGSGNDVFVARTEVGPEGRVIGLDMTPEMVSRARELAERFNAGNVEFVLGDIEAMPLSDAAVDCVISNCVLNLVPNKRHAFAEIYRVTRAGGRFSISDIVLEGDLPEELRDSVELYIGCVAGALQKDEYLRIVGDVGFTEVQVVEEKEILLPDDVIAANSTGEFAEDLLEKLRASGARVLSVTVNASKPL